MYNPFNYDISEDWFADLLKKREEREQPWYSNLSQNKGYVPQNGDIVEINSDKNKKYGHTATFYNGKWYSDFEQKEMNPYNDPNAKIRIFRNSDSNLANTAAAITASRAGKRSKHRCAQAVREGLNIATNGMYQAMGYNGNNFGDYLQRQGDWVQIAKEGIKFNKYEPINVSKQVIPFTKYDFDITELPIKTTQQEVQKETNDVPWYNGLSRPIINSPVTTISKKFNDKFIQQQFDAYKSHGLGDNASLIMSIQDALETGYGKHMSGNNNFGGIKGGNNSKKTKEVIDGKTVNVKANFKDFKDLDDYISYKIKLLNSRRYQAFKSDDPNEIIASIVKGGYATDPAYGKKLLLMYNKYI